MIMKCFLLVDVPNGRVMDNIIVLTEDIDKAEQAVRTRWADRIKPQIGVHLFKMDGDDEYCASERSMY